MARILVVGGTGLIGASAALHLAEQGHDVTIAGRNPPAPGALDRLAFVQGNYQTDDFDVAFLSRFCALVFAAANDVRQLPPNANEAAYFHQANSIAVPAFFARARAARIGRAVYVGSYYTAVLPRYRVEASGYVASRKAADDAVRAMAGDSFHVCSLEAPFIMGHVQGVGAISLEWSIRYLLGQMDNQPLWMIPGGGNFMSIRSFAEAVSGALERGENGKAYLVGDENWLFAHYYELILDALGRPQSLPVRDAEHPSMPDATLYSGRNVIVAYEPEPESVRRLGYRRHDAERAVRAMIPYYLARIGASEPGD